MTEQSGGPEQGGQRALYLRWRPRSFAEVVGQEAVVRTLRNAVARGAVAHGYLLCGPRGTGKTSLARILYKALNCAQPLDGEPCGACPSCLASDAGRALDLIEIDAASNRGIDDIRALRERVRFAPAEATWKVYIVDEAHQLTAPAWDAFLKTLEEPPPHTVFVLATTAAHKVPATIVSRCQRFDLGRIPHRSIVEQLSRIAALEGIELQAGVADRLARLADGGLRDALGMLEQVAVFAGSPVTQDAARRVLGLVRGDAIRAFVDGLSRGDARACLEVLEDVALEGADLHQFLDEVLFDLRAALLIRAGAESATASELGAEERDWLREVAGLWAPSQLASVLARLADAEAGGADERRLLIQLELATALVCGDRGVQDAPALATAPRVDQPMKPRPPQPADPSPEGRDRAPVAPSPQLSSPVGERERTPGTAQAVETPGPPAGKRNDLLDARPDAAQSADAPAPPPAEREGVRATEEPDPEVVAQPPSLAVLEARWEVLLDRFQGNLFAKMQLRKLKPARIGDGTVLLVGQLAPADAARLETARPLVESLLADEYKLPLTVRFADAAQAPVAEASADATPELSVAEYASQLFGGHLVDEESPETTETSTAAPLNGGRYGGRYDG